MTRPPRFEYPGGVYHVMTRGDGGKRIFLGKEDCQSFLHGLERVCQSHGWRVHAWVLMGNHFHLVLATRQGKREGDEARQCCRGSKPCSRGRRGRAYHPRDRGRTGIAGHDRRTAGLAERRSGKGDLRGAGEGQHLGDQRMVDGTALHGASCRHVPTCEPRPERSKNPGNR